MAQPTLKQIPLSDLKVSKLNMRHGRKKPDVSDILPSIRVSGVRQTLLVRREGDHYGVVAGRRRYFALQALAKETDKALIVPCAIMSEEDAASAIEASVIENVGRLPATEMEQYTAFKRLHEEGRTVDEIAGYFGVTELLVRRVLALASLIAPIRKLYAEDEIDRETIRALTLANEAKQVEWLTLYKSDEDREPRGRNCKAWITGGTTVTTDKALFDLTAYDGEITADLFGDQGVFTDTAEFWAVQSKAVAARMDTYLQQGWSDVECFERGVYFHKWEYTKTTKKQGGKVFIEIRHDGSVLFHEGYLSRSEARRRERKSGGENQAQATIKPEMSGPLAEYLLLHRHGAAQSSLLAQPAIAFRLMVAHAMCGSALWDIRAHECRSRKEDTRASLERSKSAGELETARKRIADLFSALNVNGESRRNSDAYRLCEVFAALLAMSDEEVGEVLAFTMAETLEAGGPAVEAVLHVCAADLADYWKPEPAFFDLTRDKRAINAMVADIGTATLAGTFKTDTGKVQKEIIEIRINGKGCEPNPDWRPGWMQVPPTRLVPGAGSPSADAWTRISALFEGETDTDAPEKNRW